MNAPDANMPRTIKEYLDSLRAALEGADPALIQDALSDAEIHLRAECAARPTIAYQLLALPLGVIYFSVTVTGLAMGLDPDLNIQIWGASPEPTSIEATLLSIATIVFGVLFLTATLHLARWLGRMHGRLAKRLLVSAAA